MLKTLVLFCTVLQVLRAPVCSDFHQTVFLQQTCFGWSNRSVIRHNNKTEVTAVYRLYVLYVDSLCEMPLVIKMTAKTHYFAMCHYSNQARHYFQIGLICCIIFAEWLICETSENNKRRNTCP